MKHKRMRQERPDRSKLTIRILIAVVAVLALFIAFFFVAQPQMKKYAVSKQIEGANFVYADIFTKIQASGFYEIPISENQSLLLAGVTQEEAQFLQQVRAQQAKAAQGQAQIQPTQ